VRGSVTWSSVIRGSFVQVMITASSRRHRQFTREVALGDQFVHHTEISAIDLRIEPSYQRVLLVSASIVASHRLSVVSLLEESGIIAGVAWWTPGVADASTRLHAPVSHPAPTWHISTPRGIIYSWMPR
jgi:hypothetical protein